MNFRRIVSGGQTGADRGGLEWAAMKGVPSGGWCPRGRKAEDGTIPEHFQLLETRSTGYGERTELNVRDSDGTVIFTEDKELSGGSRLTARMAEKHGRPWVHLLRKDGVKQCGEVLRRFAEEDGVGVLNVAGSRESRSEGMCAFVQSVLEEASCWSDQSPG